MPLANTGGDGLTLLQNRHEPTLLSHIKYNDTGELLPTLELSNSADPILTALAQLGVCRTGASRAFISLFDKEYQYIIAEATQTSSLSPNLNNAKQPDRKLWLRGTAIPRTSGVCRRVLNTSKTDGVNHEVELPINKICDIREDPNLISNSCVLLGSAARGYVGVPIRSQNGVDFGEYCVVTEQPLKEDEWSEANSTFLREISQSVLEHLLSKTSQIARGRAGKMTRGMASFLEQRSTWVDWQQYWMNGPEKEAGTEKLADGIKDTTLRQNDDVSPKSMRPRLRPDSVSSHSGLSSANLLETGSHSGDTTGPPNGSVHRRPSPTAAQLQNSSASTDQDPLTIVFSRSAAIIQESIDADGVIFFDANAGVFNSFAQHCSVSDASDSDLSDDGLDPSPHVIASSTRDALSPETGTYTSNRLKMSFKALSAFLRRHPEGAIFDFDENGNPQPSNLPDNNSQPNCRVPDGRPKLVKPRTQSFTGNLASEISKTFLGARSVAFVPVLDQVKKRPRAGCFAYTCSKTRFFGKAEINFMLAFGPLAMAEIARLETDLANRALSDVLSSLSHELRSPLHGIVSAVDFLTETPLSVFQGNLLHILETSGRTLSDTVDHLLYYARVNNFKPPGDTPDTRPRGLRREMNCTLQEGMKDLTVPVHVDELVEEVTESMFAGFNFQRSSIGQLERDLRKSRPYIHAIRQDDTQTGEDSGWWRQEDQEASGYVVIDLAIDPSCSHYYYSISGAIRRIVMNLFGNALKYTRSGSIRVALSQERVQRRKHNIMPWAKIVVADTGKGISEDFLANHLFQDFCQEDSIEPGLGLGLCVVKKIVSSLKGKVSIESKVAVGTTATVLLPLQPIPNPQITPSPPQPALSEYAEQRKKLGGLRICIVGFNTPLKLPPSSSDVKQGTQAGDYQSIWEICRTDLAMQVVPVGHEGLAPDIVLCEERELHDPCVTRERLTKAPLVVLCTDTLSAYHLSSDPHFKDPSGVAEFISQPCVYPIPLHTHTRHSLDQPLAG